MHFVIADSEGAVLDTFDNEQLARSALLRIVREYPAEAADLFLLPYGDNGQPERAAVGGDELLQELVVYFQGQFAHQTVTTSARSASSTQRRVPPAAVFASALGTAAFATA